jgi:hypothetical protein
MFTLRLPEPVMVAFTENSFLVHELSMSEAQSVRAVSNMNCLSDFI